MLKHQLLQAEVLIARLNEQTRLLKENLERSELQNEDLKSRRFCLENMTEDDSISFYTGFPNMETFQATLTYLNPSKHGENIRYWRSSQSKVEKSHFDEDNHQNTMSKRGRRRTLKPEDEFFLVMCRLRQGFHEQHLAFLFGISQSTISRIFISWINFMYLRFGTILRDLKHRQRNDTTTTAGSTIFPLELSTNLGCCQNVVQPSSTTESAKFSVLVKT